MIDNKERKTANEKKGGGWSSLAYDFPMTALVRADAAEEAFLLELLEIPFHATPRKARRNSQLGLGDFWILLDQIQYFLHSFLPSFLHSFLDTLRDCSGYFCG